jgi:hypothetical protein
MRSCRALRIDTTQFSYQLSCLPIWFSLVGYSVRYSREQYFHTSSHAPLASIFILLFPSSLSLPLSLFYLDYFTICASCHDVPISESCSRLGGKATILVAIASCVALVLPLLFSCELRLLLRPSGGFFVEQKGCRRVGREAARILRWSSMSGCTN